MKKIVRSLVFVGGIYLGFLMTSYAELHRSSEFMPSNLGDYWSYVGELVSESQQGRGNLRVEVDSTAYVDGKRTQLFDQSIIPSLAELSDEIETLNKSLFQTSENGLYIYREEFDNRVFTYDRAARVLNQDIELGKSYKYKTKVDPDSGVNALISYHTVPIGMESVEILNGTFTALKVNMEKRIKIANDEDFDDVTENISEYISSWYVSGVGVVKQDFMRTSVGSDDSKSVKYNMELVRSNYLPNYLWPDATVTEDGWTFVPWLGYLTDNYFPWVYHYDHGWMFVDAKDDSDIRFWSENLGWWFTSKDLYPTFYSHDLGDWLTFDTDSNNIERHFIRSDGSIVKASNSGFRFGASSDKPPSPNEDASTQKAGDQVFVDEDGQRYVDSDSGFSKDSGEAPTISILYPYDNTLVREGERILVLADAKDKDGIIMWVKFYVNGRLMGVSEEAPYQAVFITEDVETYIINVVTTDNYGNEVSSDDITVKVDVAEKTPPRIRVASPMNKSYYKYGEAVHVELFASDSDGFIEEVGLLVDGIQVNNSKSEPPYTFKFIPPVKGSYSIGGFAIDDDSKETKASAIVVNVNDTGIPADEVSSDLDVWFSSPQNGATYKEGDSINISVSARDGTYGIDRIQIFVNGQQIGSSSSQGSSHSVTYYPPEGVTGSIPIVARVRNGAYDSVESSITVTYD